MLLDDVGMLEPFQYADLSDSVDGNALVLGCEFDLLEGLDGLGLVVVDFGDRPIGALAQLLDLLVPVLAPVLIFPLLHVGK